MVSTPPGSVAVPQCGQKRLPEGMDARQAAQDTGADYRRPRPTLNDNHGPRVMIGQRFGSYEFVEKLGQGGMGEVYRARDTKLNRDVAIKILPAAFAADPARLARFDTEGQTLARLNHPNIAHVYGVLEIDGGNAIVMELVEGEDLSARLARGALPIDEALTVARQIAAALAAAHELGVIHRDLKPANIKVRADGDVKVLDFGLAKALGPGSDGQPSPDAANSPTLTVRGTKMGMIVGTAAYMAPEQARGKAVDRRADVWAFGLVLFEMLTGRRAFAGENVSDVIAAVLRDPVPLDRLPAGTPDAARRLLRRCLDKDRAARLDSMSAARLEIDEALQDPVTFRPRSQLPVDLPEIPPGGFQLPAADAPGNAGGSSDQRPPSDNRAPEDRAPENRAAEHRAAPALRRNRDASARNPVVVVLLVAVAAWLGITQPWKRLPASTGMQIAIDPGFDGTVVSDLHTEMAFSPDGRTIAFSGREREGGRTRLYLRRLDRLDATALQGTEDASFPFFSPDGKWIGFFLPGRLCKTPIDGGAVSVLADVQIPRGAVWGEDGVITFAPLAIPNAGLQRVPSAGGAVTPLGPMAPGHITQRWPQVLPGGRTFLYTGSSSVDTFEAACLVTQEIGGTPKVVHCGGYAWRYVPDGHVLYVNGGTLFAAPFDLSKLAITGPAVAVVPQVRGAPASGAAQFAVSPDGTLAYLPGDAAEQSIVRLVDRDGSSRTLTNVPPGWQTIAFSSDGTQLAFDSASSNAGIWLYDVNRGTASRLTRSHDDSTPVWSPDGRRLAYSSAVDGPGTLWTLPADGSDQPRRLTTHAFLQVPDSWSPDGRALLFSQATQRNQFDLWLLPIESDGVSGFKAGTPKPFVETAANEGFGTFSPDGKWIAYTSDDSGTYQVYVRAASGSGGRYQVSATNGVWPQWSRAKAELLFGALDNRVMSVTWSVENGAFRSSRPEPWTPARYESRSTFPPFALHPDGSRLAMAVEPSPAQARSVVLVTGFAAGLSAKTRRAP